MKTGSEREIVDCQAILNFLNRFNTHKVLWGRYCYSYCFIDEERKGQRSKVACPRSHRRTVEELEFAAQFWFLVDYQTQEQDSEEWKVSSLSQKKKKKKKPKSMRDTPKTQGLQLRTREMEALQWFRNGRIFKILFSGQKTLPWARFSFSAGRRTLYVCSEPCVWFLGFSDCELHFTAKGLERKLSCLIDGRWYVTVFPQNVTSFIVPKPDQSSKPKPPGETSKMKSPTQD